MITDDYEDLGFVMSNFDRHIDRDIEKKLKEGKFSAGYAGWDFYGTVYFEDGKFHCIVKSYGSVVGNYSSETLEEIMEEVSNIHGHD